jgi:hypothetical protein
LGEATYFSSFEKACGVVFDMYRQETVFVKSCPSGEDQRSIGCLKLSEQEIPRPFGIGHGASGLGGVIEAIRHLVLENAHAVLSVCLLCIGIGLRKSECQGD